MFILSDFFLNILSYLFLLVSVLIMVGFLTLFERKMMGVVHNRVGPDKVGMMGILQPVGDAFKLLSNELFYLNSASQIYYFLSPLFMILISMMLWFTYPFFTNVVFMNMSLMYLFSCLSLSTYTFIFAGWSSNSNYSMLGAVRAVAQAISYEVSFMLVIFNLVMLVSSFSFNDFIKSQVYMKFFFFMFPIYLLFFISILAELNRTPFDLVEGESELVSGFNVEYFSGTFTLMYMAEYMNILFMSVLMEILFFGFEVTSMMYYLLVGGNMFMIILIRTMLPRVRYDELMFLCWKKILPVVLQLVIYVYMLKLWIEYILF